MSDERLLIKRMRAGDADAGRRLVREHYAAIYRMLANLTRDAHRAEDLCQETFATAWRKLDSFDFRSAFGTWLHRIAYRRFLDWRRSTPGREVTRAVEVSAESSPLKDVIAGEQSQMLRDAIDRLDGPLREVLVLHYLNGLLHREVAEITDTPVGTIRWRTREALQQLKKLLPDEMNDESRRTEKPHATTRPVATGTDPAGA